MTSMRTATANCAKTACTSSCASTTPSATERWRSRSSSPAPRRTRSHLGDPETLSMNVTGRGFFEGRWRWVACTATAATSSTWSARRPTESSLAGGDDLVLPELRRLARPRPLQPHQPVYEAVSNEPAGKVVRMLHFERLHRHLDGRWVQSCCGLTSTRAPACSPMAACATSRACAYCWVRRRAAAGVTPFQVNVPVVLDRVGWCPAPTCSLIRPAPSSSSRRAH